MWIRKKLYRSMLDDIERLERQNANAQAEILKLREKVNNMSDRLVEATKGFASANAELERYKPKRGAGGKFVAKK